MKGSYMNDYFKYIETPMNAPLHAKRIAKLLNEKGWSQDRFADEIGISKSSVSNWLQGNKQGIFATPRIDNFNDAANALGVSVDYLLGNTDVKTIDTNIQSACGYTGLSEDAIELLHSWNNAHPIDLEPEMLNLLSSLITNPRFHELMLYIYSVKTATKELEDNEKELIAKYDLMERVDASLWKSSRVFTDIIEDITSNQKGE